MIDMDYEESKEGFGEQRLTVVWNPQDEEVDHNEKNPFEAFSQDRA